MISLSFLVPFFRSHSGKQQIARWCNNKLQILLQEWGEWDRRKWTKVFQHFYWWWGMLYEYFLWKRKNMYNKKIGDWRDGLAVKSTSIWNIFMFIAKFITVFSFKVQFEISITANKCPNKESETIKIKPLGFTEEVEVVLQFICKCNCQSHGIPASPKCHEGNGTFECGACR